MINSLPSNFANAVTPYAPLGRQAVSEESTDLKSTSFKPLEESAQAARGANQRSPEQRAGEVEERERTRISANAQDSEGEQADADIANQEKNTVEARVKRQQQELERDEIRELAARDREVRAHERAHAAVGGQYAGAPSYQYTRGPDGVNYAVAGEVSIDTSPVPNNPEATLEKAQQIQRAATAPAEPSAQDRRVAAKAAQLAVEARADILIEQREARRLEEEAAAEAREQQSERVASGLEPEDQLKKEAEEQRRREERAQEFAETSARNIDINRRLIEIGVIEPPTNNAPRVNQRI